MVSPVEDEIKSTIYFDENKCVSLPHKTGNQNISEGTVEIHEEPTHELEQENHKENIAQDNRIEYVTDEILSMMLFSDIHDHCLFPFRTNQVLKEAKHKFPFNKPLGINTNELGVSEFLDHLISHIKRGKSVNVIHQLEEAKESTYLDEVITNLEKSIKIDPIIELAQLQLYEESPQKSNCSDEILSNEIFYSLQQERKSMHDGKDGDIAITNEEKSNKIHTTFIHDKMLFDSFNYALNLVAKRKIEMPPWHFGTKSLAQKRYSKTQTIELLTKTKDLVLNWNRIEAGTNKIPPYTGPENTKIDDIFAPPPPIPTDEERNQQIREEKLSELLSREINEEEENYHDCATQVKLDLADMILEDLAIEMAQVLTSM